MTGPAAAPPRLLPDEYDEAGRRNHHIQTTTGGHDEGATVAHVLTAVARAVAVEDLLPAGIRDGDRILFDDVAVRKRGVVQAGDDDNFLGR